MNSQDILPSDSHRDRTVKLAEGMGQEAVVVLQYGADFLDELAGLGQSKKLFDLVLVDCIQSGFYFMADALIEAARLAKSLLAVQGALVFIKSDQTVAIIKESVVGLLTFQYFNSVSEVYDYSPVLAQHVQTVLGSQTALETSADLSEQILLSCVPVLTSFGIRLKAGMESNKRRNVVLSVIDSYTPLSAIAAHLQDRVPFAELLEEAKSLEESGAIFPVFAKIPFLVHSFRNRLPFQLKDYLLESKLVTAEQLENVMLARQSNQESVRRSLDSLCVASGLISSRQLEIALQDQAFYGQGSEEKKTKLHVHDGHATKLQSLVGHLGTTDPSGVLQSLANNHESGVLSVEYKDMQFRALFEQGKLVKAKMLKLKGDRAVIEFVSVWKEGIFVFVERVPPPDLVHESCQVTKSLDKLLLDSALAADLIAAVLKNLPKGANTPLEKLADTQGLLEQGSIVDPQDQRNLASEEVALLQKLWQELDGLSPVGAIVKKLADVTTLEATMAIRCLLALILVAVPDEDLFSPLGKFQTIVSNVAQHIGLERTNALLRLSLQSSQGYSTKARMFSIGTSCELGVDVSMARSAGLSLSQVIKELEDWQVSFIEYVSQELDKSILREIVYRVHRF